MSTIRDKPLSSFDTLPLSDRLEDPPFPSVLAFRRRFLVVIYHRDGVEMIPLAPSASVVVGRDPLADVPIQDGSLSRRHARFTLEGGEVIVEDLASTNGTRIAGQRIERAVVEPGGEVQLGSLTACVHVLSKAQALAGSEGASMGIQSHEAFQRALDAEIARARFFGRKLALLLVHARNGEDGNLRRWLPRVRELLRPVDHAALYSADAIEILAPEMALEQAVEFARAVVAPREGEPGLGCGVACFPDAATSAEKLIEVGREAARSASETEPVRIAPTEGPRVLLPGAEASESPDGDALIAKSQPMRIVIETALRVARSAIPVLLHGETGTGKEVVARLIHGASPRRAAPLICVNCGAIPQSLAESTLFGYERGAFTGAMQQQKGVFEAAHGGTVLLDEIGELPAAVQAALLRVTETKRVARVGSTKEVGIDVRLIAATHRDLEAMADAGSFRRDLLYRLNAMTLTLPPLRERPEDIAPLAVRFLERASRGSGRMLLGIRPEALSLLESYSWPGNVRELRNAIERAVAIASSDIIEVRDLPERVRMPRGRAKLTGAMGGGAGLPNVPSVPGATSIPGEAQGADASGPMPAVRGTFKERMEQLEVEVLIGALREAGWNQTEAARRLDMPLRTLQYKIKTLGIKRGGYRARPGDPE